MRTNHEIPTGPLQQGYIVSRDRNPLGVEGVGFGVEGLGFRVQGLGFRV